MIPRNSRWNDVDTAAFSQIQPKHKVRWQDVRNRQENPAPKASKSRRCRSGRKPWSGCGDLSAGLPDLQAWNDLKFELGAVFIQELEVVEDQNPGE